MPIVGFRTWLVQTPPGKLFPRSITRPYVWTAGVNTAECVVPKGEPRCVRPPGGCSGNNGCGFHAYHSVDDIKAGSLGGIVVGGGDVMVHHNAWRAEQAMVVAMIDSGWDETAQSLVYSRRSLETLAEYFGVRVVPREAAMTVAREYGDPVPAHLIPEELRDRSGERG